MHNLPNSIVLQCIVLQLFAWLSCVCLADWGLRPLSAQHSWRILLQSLSSLGKIKIPSSLSTEHVLFLYHCKVEKKCNLKSHKSENSPISVTAGIPFGVTVTHFLSFITLLKLWQPLIHSTSLKVYTLRHFETEVFFPLSITVNTFIQVIACISNSFYFVGQL